MKGWFVEGTVAASGQKNPVRGQNCVPSHPFFCKCREMHSFHFKSTLLLVINAITLVVIVNVLCCMLMSLALRL